MNSDSEEDLINSSYKKEGKKKPYVIYKYRWVSLIAFCFICFCLQCSWGIYVPIISLISAIYDVPLYIVNINLIVLSFPSFPFGFVANYIIAKKGVKVSVCIGGCCLIVGLLIRIFVRYSFYFVLLGSFFLGVSSPFLENGITKVSSNWFPTNQRSLATTINRAILIFGDILGYFLPIVLIPLGSKDAKKLTPQDKQDGKEQVFWCSIYMLIAFTIVICVGLLLFKNKPKTPPTPTADKDKECKENYCEGIKKLVTNLNFILFMISFTVVLLCFESELYALSVFLSAFGYNTDTASTMGICNLFAGQIGCWFGGTLLHKTLQYKRIHHFITIGMCVTMFLFFFTLNFEKLYLSIIIYTISGFFNYQLVFISYEYAAELGFPVGESTTLFCLGAPEGVFSIATTMAYGVYLNEANKKTANIFFVFVVAICVGANILSFFVKEKLNRIDYDRRKSTIRENEIYPPDKNPKFELKTQEFHESEYPTDV